MMIFMFFYFKNIQKIIVFILLRQMLFYSKKQEMGLVVDINFLKRYLGFF